MRKKEKNTYITYVLKINEAKLDVFEDFAEEEVKSFDDLESAVQYIMSQGAEIKKLAAIKSTLPFWMCSDNMNDCFA
jgi:hypothetical protein